MSLTQQQERLIANYLRDVALHIGPDVSTSRARRALDVLEARIRKSIDSRGGGVIQDSDVARVLDDLGEPQKHAGEIRPDMKPKSGTSDQVWLGVCAHWAKQLDVPVRVVRIGVFLSGLVTGPLALWTYVAAYAHLWYITPAEKRPEIAYTRIAWNIFSCILIATLLSWVLDFALGSIKFLWDGQFLSKEAPAKPLPDVGSWGWIIYDGPGYYSLTLITILPIAALAALPLAGGWDHSLRRLYFAILTLYGIYLSYGLASLFVGLVLKIVEQYGGINLMDYLPTT